MVIRVDPSASASMGRRLTEKPIRAGWTITEGTVNVFTTQTLALPGAFSIQIGRKRGSKVAIGAEIMKFVTELDLPSVEAGQLNSIVMECIKGAAPTALVGMFDQRNIARRNVDNAEVEVTAVGEMFNPAREKITYQDLTDGDGNGELVLDDQVHISIKGAGNANTRSGSGYILFHLYEFDLDEAIFEVLEQAV